RWREEAAVGQGGLAKRNPPARPARRNTLRCCALLARPARRNTLRCCALRSTHKSTLRPASRGRARLRSIPTSGERRNAARIPPFLGGQVARLADGPRRLGGSFFCLFIFQIPMRWRRRTDYTSNKNRGILPRASTPPLAGGHPGAPI